MERMGKEATGRCIEALFRVENHGNAPNETRLHELSSAVDGYVKGRT